MTDALPPEVLEYILQGAREGVTASEATAGWRAVRLLPHVLRDVTEVDLATTLLGAPAAVPFAIAPTTLQRAVHPDGEVAMAQAARDAGTVVVVSSNAGTPFRDIGATGAADAAFLGRTPLLALTGGRGGVTHMLEELRDELVEALRLAGCRTPADTRGLAAPNSPNRL